MKTRTNCPDCTDGFEIINCSHGQKKIPCCRCQPRDFTLSSDDIGLFDELFGDGDTATRFREAWNRIKDYLVLVQHITNTRCDETALFESIYELLCGVGDDKVRDSIIAKVNTRIVQLRAGGKTDFDHKDEIIVSINEDLERCTVPELVRIYKFIRTHFIANIPGLQAPDAKNE